MNPTSRHRRQALVLAAATTLIGGVLASTTAGAAAPAAQGKSKQAAVASATSDVDRGHVMPHPLKIARERAAQKQEALERVIQGKRPFPKGVGPSRQVPLELEGTDRIFVVLAEFGNQRYETATDKRFVDPPNNGFTLPAPTPTTFDGPLHNQIPAPDRAVDNSTLWQPDYDRAHYEDMYFNRMAAYYQRQSSGRYSVDGDVTEWVKVPYNQALYGRGYCGTPPGAPVTSCPSSRALIRDALAVWVANQLASGQTMTQIQDYLRTFDHQDRYDSDLDGNYDEPDGFIDHFQIVHAGGDEAAGDPTYGSDAIWSHRSYANLQAGGPGGRTGVNVGSNGGAFGLGATAANPVPNNPTGVWVGDYTVQPENGGLGVFAHEFAHDLGLPDLYDTSGNTGGAENNTAFWTLMSSGANIGDGGPDGIGDAPTDMGAWELLQLGWLDEQNGKGPFYDVASAGERSQHRLSTNVPATTNGQQAVVVNLPDNEVPYSIGEPAQGEWMWWSQQGSNLENTMTKTGVGPGTLTAKVNYAMEEEYDYAYIEASSNGTDFTPVDTSLSDHPGHVGHDPDGNNPTGFGITGSSDDAWVDVTATLPAGTTAVRFRYSTDPFVAESGIKVDQVALNGVSIGDAEAGNDGWVLDGFIRSNGTEVESFFNAYVVENRQYDGYDTSLRTAYNFGFLDSRPDWVETYPYQNGVLISYWNEQYGANVQYDNNVGDHPGEGFLLPVDAHPQFSHWPDGTLMRNRILSYDSTFGYEKTQAITLHNSGMTGTVPSRPGVPVFDDTLQWWFNSDEHGATGAHPGRYQPGWYSVDVPKTGTSISVARPGSRHGVVDIVVAPTD